VHCFTPKRSKMKGLASTLRAGGSLAVLVWAGIVSLPAQAASFHCSAHSSYSEKAVCGDVYLSTLDDKLNAVYKQAVDVTPDRQSLEDARTQQWQWRQANCHTQACVTDWYERRISELDADVIQGKKAQRVAFEQRIEAQKLTPDAANAIRDLKLNDKAAIARASVPHLETVAKVTPAVPRTEQVGSSSSQPAKGNGRGKCPQGGCEEHSQSRRCRNERGANRYQRSACVCARTCPCTRNCRCHQGCRQSRPPRSHRNDEACTRCSAQHDHQRRDTHPERDHQHIEVTGK